MGMLTNQRHELFAQALAAGKTQDQAYKDAGYEPDRPHASRLATNGNVRARVEELQARATEGVVISRQWIIERLVENVNRSKEIDEISARNRALELLGKEYGMFIDKHEIDQTTTVLSADPMTPDEWEAEFGNRLDVAGVN